LKIQGKSIKYTFGDEAGIILILKMIAEVMEDDIRALFLKLDTKGTFQ
jgi:hypothetical protein